MYIHTYVHAIYGTCEPPKVGHLVSIQPVAEQRA